MSSFTTILLILTVIAVAAAAQLARALVRLRHELSQLTAQRALETSAPGQATALLDAPRVTPVEPERAFPTTNGKPLPSREDALRQELALARAERARLAVAIAKARGEANGEQAREPAAPSEQELSAARRERAEAIEARRVAEEEARVARVAKDSYAGEALLLREELKRANARLAEATGASGAAARPAAAPVETAKAAPELSRWWCTSCGRGGTRAEPCCANAR